jgi:signal transduction histidine kinase
MNSPLPAGPELRQAYVRYQLDTNIRNSAVASALVVVLMPAGYVLDRFVYKEFAAPHFLLVRFITSFLAALVFIGLCKRGLSDRFYRVLCTGWYLLPAASISWMINQTEGATSPYYAGLNLVILAVSSVIQATLLESALAIASILSLYALACVLHAGGVDWRMAFNNLYFFFCTSAIVLTGNFFYNRLRFREFSLRYELNANREQLEETHRKLVELDQAKGRFFANISHELRTPLTLLISPLETLLHQYKWDDQTKMLLTTMQSNGMRLLKLINDLLDLVRLESGTIVIKLEPMKVDEFIKGEASAARSVAEDKRIRLETFVDPTLGSLMADRDKLEKIVLNLVFNALKFTPAGGRVELRAEKQGEEFVIIVSDTGMGISATNLANVFSRFWQADDTSRRKYQGVGIGLALVKELSIAHGGDVSVASEQGKGTTFTVRLPYKKTEADAPAKIQESAKPEPTAQPAGTVTSQEWLANLYRRAELFPSMTPLQETLRQVETAHNGNHTPTLLVADDEPDMLRYLKSQLATHYRVVEAVDGQQAIEKAAQFLPDIILLDMMMPEKDGLQACREIRQRTSTQSIPVILLTARADEETKMAALSAGANDFLSKPFSTTELHVRIKNLVESHQYQIKLSKQKTVLEHTIEQLKETETQLVQTEKLASLGRMSAGIIHEINNPLNFATTGLFTLRNKGKDLAPDQQAEYQEVLQDVEDGLKRVKTIVSELRTFTHPDMEGRDQVEVSEIVSSAVRFLSNELKDKVVIEQSLTEHQTIWANKSKLIQVLVNLLHNSLDALKSKVFENEKPTVRIEGFVEKNKSILRVRDNGTGIDPKILDKIFDPFFTTKDVGEGMGLGLSICYRIVEECDGRISVKTEPGKFCEFTLEFPAKG